MEIGIAVDNTIPLHFPSFAEFIRAHSKTINCHAIKAPLRFVQTKIVYEVEIAKLDGAMRKEIESNDLSLLVTAIPFENNFFYIGNDTIYIISLSDWHLWTTLPMSNGLAYMLCQIILTYQMNIGQTHGEKTGCISDFMWDKTGIDVCLRAAFLCDHCKAHSADNPHLATKEFADIVSILNSISLASRRAVDILLEPHASGTAASKSDVEERFDVFLCHNSVDKPAVRLLNETLRSANIRTWLDEKQIQPGEIWPDMLEAIISRIAACLVIVGDSGFGPWQDMERRAFINEFANRGCKIIPVLIGKPNMVPELPLFLKQFMWSDLRNNDGPQLARLISSLRR